MPNSWIVDNSASNNTVILQFVSPSRLAASTANKQPTQSITSVCLQSWRAVRERRRLGEERIRRTAPPALTHQPVPIRPAKKRIRVSSVDAEAISSADNRRRRRR